MSEFSADVSTDSILIAPVSRPIQGRIRPPGSKSLTNRALIIAAMAAMSGGRTKLTGALDSIDTRVMVESLQKLGVQINHDRAAGIIDVTRGERTDSLENVSLYLENSGTSIRFLTAFCATLDFHGEILLDGNTRMRQRPIQDLVNALNELGADIECRDSGCPPVRVRRVKQLAGLSGGSARVASNLSSQYLSALLMAAPGAKSPVELHLIGDLVSEPYVDMTIGIMQDFGVEVERIVGADTGYRIVPQSYRSREYDIEPDASAASYFLAAAAITGGSVTVTGLNRNALQGDIRFADALERMGCEVDWGPTSVTVHGKPLRGIEIDMNEISDTAQTLAAVAVFATGSTTIRNIAHNRHKETDRITAVATELRKLGLSVDEFADGMTIHPGAPAPATIDTYDDHRMAMSFALVGLRAPGIRIADPGCTSKTYPHFFDDLKTLCETGGSGSGPNCPTQSGQS